MGSWILTKSDRERLSNNVSDQVTLDECYRTITQLKADLRDSKSEFHLLDVAYQRLSEAASEKNQTIAKHEQDMIGIRADSQRMRGHVTRLVGIITQLKNSNLNLQAQVDSRSSDEATRVSAAQYATELHERCMQYERALEEAKLHLKSAEDKALFEAMYRNEHTSYTDKNVQDWIEQNAERKRQAE